MKRIIVNADDYGLCPKVNEGILSAYACGAVTDFSFMVNSLTFDGALSSLSRNGIRRCGLHLNLTSGSSIDGNRKLPSLKRLMIDLALKRLSVSDVIKEIDSQIEIVIRSDLEITHLDSHQNVHLLPFIFGHIMDRIEAESWKIPVRIPSETIVRPFATSASNLVRLSSLRILSLYPRIRHKPAVQVVGQKFLGNKDKETLFDEVVKTIHSSDKESFEFPVHPGLCDCAAEPECRDTYTRMREEELSFLMRNTDFFAARGIEKVSFADVKQ